MKDEERQLHSVLGFFHPSSFILPMARYANWQSDGAQTSESVGSTPTRVTWKCAGWLWEARRSVKPPLIAKQVRFLPDALNGSLVYARRGHRSLKPERGVRLPCGLLLRFGFVSDWFRISIFGFRISSFW